MMKSWFVARAAVGLAVVAFPGVALAQAAPGAEVIGQPIQVTTNGVTNTVFLDPNGALRIITPGGNTIPGTWNIANAQLCIGANGAQECIPYSGPFQPQQPQTLTSSCGSTETWLAQNTNGPAQGQKGERGR
jgi:hypothetical protein